MSNAYIPDQLHHMSKKELLEFAQTAHEENVKLVQQIADITKSQNSAVHRAYKAEQGLTKANERCAELESYNVRLANESHEYQQRCSDLEKNQLLVENGKNRYGLDVSYFRNVINRELNRPLTNHKPDELARVLAILSRTADESVMFEPQFSAKFALKNKIEALTSFADYAKGDDWEDAHLQEAIKIEIEQLRKGGE